MLTVSQLSKAFGARVLFHDVSFHVGPDDRIGIVGPNGSGKSTLFKLLLGELEPDRGTIAFRKGVSVGYLPQEIAPRGSESVLELATALTPEIAGLRRALRTAAPESEAWHAARERLEALRAADLEPKARRILAGLAFRPSDLDQPTAALSGGWIMRAHLARLLVHAPDLLLLDEPTNHLDIESLLWLQEHLGAYRGALLMISHDREWLNTLAGGIFELERGRVLRYRGNYDAYLDQRARRAAQQEAAYKNQQRRIAALQRFADRFGAKATKAAQAQSKRKQIARMERIEAPPGADPVIRFRWPQPARSGLLVAALEGVDHAYGPAPVYRGLTLRIERGQRIVLVGPNGAGKSTLLKLLAGVLPIQAGTRTLGLHVTAGYYAQHRLEMLDPGQTALDAVLGGPHAIGEQEARSVLGAFLFRGDDVFKRVAVLSGGEKSRLALVTLLTNPPNFLLMDEPTTHLDLPGVEALIEALRHFQGTLVFISHDVYFIRAMATRVLHIQAGAITPYAGDYQYYLDRTRAANAPPAGMSDARPDAPAGSARKAARRREAEARQAAFRARRDHDKRRVRLEREIEALETRQAALTAELEDPATYAAPGKPQTLNRELTDAVDRLARLYADWEQAVAAIEGDSPAPPASPSGDQQPADPSRRVL